MALGKNLLRKKDNLFPDEKVEKGKSAKKKSKNKSNEKLIISGEINISKIHEIHKNILSKIKAKKPLSITIKNIKKIDVTFYQLILALENEKGIELKLILNEQQKNGALKLGLNDEVFV